MPELPEVETTCQGITPFIQGQLLKEIVIHEYRLRWPVPKILTKLKNLSIINIARRAKYILIITSAGTLIIHLGMSGRLNIFNNNIPLKKHDHAIFIFKNGLHLRFNDPRRFGAILWIEREDVSVLQKDINEHPLFAHLGPEPLEAGFHTEYLLQKLHKRKTNIKQCIMDASVVVGVGNIYANEALFLAKISPLRKAHTITKSEYGRLVLAIRKVLKLAIKAGGTTLKDFLRPTGKPGYFAQKLLVYGRENKPCIHCEKPLILLRISQRATVYCDACQS